MQTAPAEKGCSHPLRPEQTPPLKQVTGYSLREFCRPSESLLARIAMSDLELLQPLSSSLNLCPGGYLLAAQSDGPILWGSSRLLG